MWPHQMCGHRRCVSALATAVGPDRTGNRITERGGVCAYEAEPEGAGVGPVECARPASDAQGMRKVYTGMGPASCIACQ